MSAEFKTKKPLAFVIQRFGADIDGGAENHCLQLTVRLKRIMPLEIITTCAQDYITWKNVYKPGTDMVEGVTVHRFPNSETRDMRVFNEFSKKIFGALSSKEEQLEWIRRQGPYCPDLIEFIRQNRRRYSGFIFYVYLYYPTYYGVQIEPEKSILVPTAHDEPAIRLPVFKEMFKAPAGFLFLTEKEKEFVESIFSMGDRPYDVIGAGISKPLRTDPARFRKKYGIQSPYLLVMGRIEAGKGCSELVRYFLEMKSRRPSNLQLLFIGKLHMELPDHPDISYIGFLPDDDKFDAVSGAEAVAIPSPFESLSIAALEAMSCGVPIIVNENCSVLADHCIKSNGGLYYKNSEEFMEIVALLGQNSEMRSKMGKNGQKYVQSFYSWNRVVRKFCKNVREMFGDDADC